MKRTKHREGFVHIFFIGAVVMLFMVFFTLTSEAMDQKLIRKELAVKLQLDYSAEAYYLLLREGEIEAKPGISYGDLDLRELQNNHPNIRYIEVINEGGKILVIPWYDGKKRGEYEIKKEEGLHNDGDYVISGVYIYANQLIF